MDDNGDYKRAAHATRNVMIQYMTQITNARDRTL